MKKKEPAGKGIEPVDRVKELTSKGFSEIEVIDVLRKEGYSTDEIDRALTHALRFGVTATQESATPKKDNENLPTIDEIAPASQKATMPQMPETSLPEEYYQQNYPTEEYVDYIVDEKVSEVDRKMNDISVRTVDLEQRIKSIQEKIGEFSKLRESEENKILNKIDNFSETATEMNIRLGGLEKAFKETLPALIESVRALCDLVQRLKREA